MDSDQVACKDCVHSFRKFIDLPMWGSGYEYRCKNFWVDEKTVFDPVTGENLEPGKYEKCSVIRVLENHPCGRTGKLWSPKNKQDFFFYMKRIK
jgi:hypothetical protein